MDYNNDVVIIGAGDYARELVDLLHALKIGVVGFIDIGQPNKEIYKGLRVLGDEGDYLRRYKEYPFLMGMGDVHLRKRISELLEAKGGKPSDPIIPPEVSYYMGSENIIGQGTVFHQGSVITNRCKIGKHCLINLNVTIGHDVMIGDFCDLSPGVHLNGHTKLGTLVTMGSGSVSIPKVSIGSEVIVGAGAVVTRDIPNHCIAVGVPAKPIK